MSTYDRLTSTLVGEGDEARYTLSYREDAPLPAFLGGQRQDEVTLHGKDVEWLAIAARDVADDMFEHNGRSHWINRRGERCSDGREATLIVRGAEITIRDQDRRSITMGWAGLNWVAWNLDSVRLAARQAGRNTLR